MALRQQRILLTWLARHHWRDLCDRLLHTLQGRLAGGIVLLALPSVVGILRGPSVLIPDTATDSTRWGVLLLGEISVYLCLLLFVLAQLLRSLSRAESTHPLDLIPSLRYPIEIQRQLKPIAAGSAYLWASFGLLHYPILASMRGGAPVALAALLLTAPPTCLALGVWMTRRVRQRFDGRAAPVAAFHLVAVSFLLAYPLIFLLPQLFLHLHPHAVEWLGRSRAGPALFVPTLAFHQAITAPSLWPALLWTALLFLLSRRSLLVLKLMSRAPTLVRPSGHQRIISLHSLFGRMEGATVRSVQAFAVRDLIAPLRLGWSSRLQREGAILILTLGGLLLLSSVVGRELPIQVGGSQPLWFLLLFLPLALGGMPITLGCLGREGALLDDLRLIMAPRELFRPILVVIATHSFLSILMRGGLLWGIAKVLQQNPPALVTLVAGVAPWIGVMLLLGTVLGFLLPDFQRSHPLLPGSTAASRWIYVGGLMALAQGILLAPSAAPAVLATTLLLPLLLWSLRRTKRTHP